MRAALIGLALLLVAAPAAQRDTTPPPPPGPLTVGAPALEPTGALFKVTWEAVLDPPANLPVPVSLDRGIQRRQRGHTRRRGGYRTHAANALPRERGDVRVRLCPSGERRWQS